MNTAFHPKDTYQWYEEGYRYPVFETVESFRKVAGNLIPLRQESYFYHPAEQAFYLPEDTANLAVLKKKLAAKEAKILLKKGNVIAFCCYPNPVKDNLEIELSISRPVKVRTCLFDLQGKMIYQSPVKEQVGQIHETLNVNAYPEGNYLLTIFIGNEKISEKIVKR